MKHAPYLLVDNSNTWTKFCTASEKRIGQVTHIATSSLTLKSLKQIRQNNSQARVILCSVVPRIKELFCKIWPTSQRLILDHKTPPFGRDIGIDYPKPETIGGDRLANTVACAYLYKLPAIVVDFGTATTFDVISNERKYLGGVIAPGLNAMTHYLHEKTALLPKITLKRPRKVIGKSTIEAMHSGAFTGYCGMIKEILQKIKRDLPQKKISVIATGGQGDILTKEILEIQQTDSLITLRGLHLTAQHNFGPLAEK